MEPIPPATPSTFEALLEEKAIPPRQQGDYKKLLRYFLDFSSKYPLPPARSGQVRLFLKKLRQQNQTPFQQNQAAQALSLYFEMLRKKEAPVADVRTYIPKQPASNPPPA